jgi:methylmalonyl-CoA mutase cobalamin-binding subunit
VHEHATVIIDELLSKAGAVMINLGAEINPDQIASAASKNIDAILISTHNGMALEYAKCLKKELNKHGLRIPVVMGGILNQKIEDAALPIDVTANLKELGFYPCPKLESKFNLLLEYNLTDGKKIETK